VVRAAALAGGGRGGERLVHDPPDGAGAAAALRRAAETAVDLSGRARPYVGLHDLAHVVIAQHIAGADDHDGSRQQPLLSYRTGPFRAKEKRISYTLSKVQKPRFYRLLAAVRPP